MSTASSQAVICVFCGSKPGKNAANMEAARSLAQAMHAAGAKLVYGGGTTGLMGEVARTLVELAGPDAVHGVIPAELVKYERQGEDKQIESGATTATTFGRQTVVADMHTRKKMMVQEVLAGGPGSGFVALPGGYGTLEELMEITTWNQLGIHDRPICLLNINHFYDGLTAWIRAAVAEDFVVEANRNIITVATDAAGVIPALADYKVAQGRFKLDWTSTAPK